MVKLKYLLAVLVLGLLMGAAKCGSESSEPASEEPATSSEVEPAPDAGAQEDISEPAPIDEEQPAEEPVDEAE